MGKLVCSRCGAEIEHEVLTYAVEHLDHSVGKHNGRGCPNDPNQYPVFWDGKSVIFKNGKPVIAAKDEPKVEEKPTPKPKSKK